MQAWYRLSVEEVLQKLSTSRSGLKEGDIPGRVEKYGRNILRKAPRKSKLSILLGQFKDVMIIILIVAAVVSFIVGEATDALVILAIIIVNAWIGFSQESNAEEAVMLLQKMAAQYAAVVRDGNPLKVDATELVPGDIILLEAGDIVPADARLIEVSAFKTDEAALTGESHTVVKTTDRIDTDNPIPGDQTNMVFKGTIVSNGSARAVVTATGMKTEIGNIAGLMDIGDQKTPLQKRLAVFSKQLTVGVAVICLVVFGAGLYRGEPPYLMFLTALSLAVAALPEALPAVITIALAQGARRMVKQNALVRRLPAVETLGSVTYICSDKTGTLTRNVMTVEKVMAAPGLERLLMDAMMLNNEVRFTDKSDVHGDSTETALVNYVLEQGYSKTEAENKYPLKDKLPFDSERMRMSTLHADQDKYILFVKGAPGSVASQLSEKHKDSVNEWLDINRAWAADGLRVLFFGYRTFHRPPETLTPGLEKELDFLGMVAMMDPPREEVIEAIRECKTAGIKSVMITGDQPLTANAIAERLGMIEEGSKNTKTGAELANIPEEEFVKTVRNISVYARVSPEQKLNIVKALQQNNEFVSMTGDGVNDAPSLKQADIGVAMGITGTDVSKEAADMILLDDNFATIVKAVREGRRIYENIKKFILYVLSCNLAEVLTIFLAPFLGLAIPLLPIHILWINLVTDGLPGITLTAEPAEDDIMRRPPRSPRENLFAGGMIPHIVFTGVIMSGAVLLVQAWVAREGYEVRTQQTTVFTLLCFVQLGNALSVRSVHHSIVSKSIFSNRAIWGAVILSAGLQVVLVYSPPLHGIFKTTNLDWPIMRIVLIALGVSMALIELSKLLRNKYFNTR